MWTKGVLERGAGAVGLAVLVAALLLANRVPAADAAPLDRSHVDAFLTRIEGEWSGVAVVTPIGPRPYDISFAPNAAGRLEGSANPGDATHTWTFYREGEGLSLRFFSTFRGNRRPIILVSTGEIDGALNFRALQPDLLQVRIGSVPQGLVIRVLHHDRLHVEIHLRRK